jgi:hypothetical protein
MPEIIFKSFDLTSFYLIDSVGVGVGGWIIAVPEKMVFNYASKKSTQIFCRVIKTCEPL